MIAKTQEHTDVHAADRPLDVAVFFDFENIVYSVRNIYGVNANFEDLMEKCKEFGRVVVAHAFADWSRHASMIPALMSNGFDPVYVPTFQIGGDGTQMVRKNAVDMYMAIDAMDVLHTRKTVDAYILLTGDSDFLPLVNAIRREGNKVIAIGVDGSVSSSLAQAVDEFILYSQVSQLDTAKLKRPTNAYDGLVVALNELSDKGKSAVLPNVKMMMAELMGGFDEKKLTDSKGRRFQKFKDFIIEAQRKGLVKLISSGTVNEVYLPEKAPSRRRGPSSTGREKEKEKEKEKDGGFVEQPNLNEAYELLKEAILKCIKEEQPLRTSIVKSAMVELRDGFNEKEVEYEEGKTFSRFSDFVKAAQKAGHITLSGKGANMQVALVDEVVSEEAAKEAVAEAAPAPPAEEKPSKADKPSKKEEKPGKKEASVPTPGKDGRTLTELEGKELIVDALKSFSNYPNSFLEIEAYCRRLRNERQVYLPSPKVRELLTEATQKAGLLKRVSPVGVSPAQYEPNIDEKRLKSYLGEKAAKEKAKSQEKVAAPEPSANGSELQEAFNLLVEATRVATEKGNSRRLSAISTRMGKMSDGFDFKSLTDNNGKKFKRFGEFAAAAQKAGLVTIEGKGVKAEIKLAK